MSRFSRDHLRASLLAQARCAHGAPAVLEETGKGRESDMRGEPSDTPQGKLFNVRERRIAVVFDVICVNKNRLKKNHGADCRHTNPPLAGRKLM